MSSNLFGKNDIWVLREYHGTLVYIQFLDLEKKVAFADSYRIEIKMSDKLIEIGSGLFEYSIKKDILTIKNDLAKYVFRLYKSRPKDIELSKVYDSQWLVRGNQHVFSFKDALISSRGNEKQLVVISDGIPIGGEWMSYEYCGIFLLRYELPNSKSDFLIINSVGDSYFEANKWISEDQLEVALRFDNLNID